MQINHLPPDLLRPIVRLLDFDSLTSLYATFDFKMLSLLATPNLIDYLRATPHQRRLSAIEGAFLHHIQHVDRVELQMGLTIEESPIGLLLRLNPRELTLVAPYKGAFPQCKLIELEIPDGSSTEQSKSVFNLAKLAPRLERLQVYSAFHSNSIQLARAMLSMPDHIHFISLPPTLTSLGFQREPPNPLNSFSSLENGTMNVTPTFISELPTNLMSLSLHFTCEHPPIPWQLLSEKLPSLEYLSLKGHIEPSTTQEIVLPRSLTSLDLHTDPFQSNLFKYLKQTSITCLSVSTDRSFGAEGRDAELDLNAFLPPVCSLALDLRSSPFNEAAPLKVPFPISLTELSVTTRCGLDAALDTLAALTSLETFKLYVASGTLKILALPPNLERESPAAMPFILKKRIGAGLTQFRVHLLPPSLTSLSLGDHCCHQLTNIGISALPPNLKHLTVPFLALQDLYYLNSRLPNCHAYFTDDNGLSKICNAQNVHFLHIMN